MQTGKIMSETRDRLFQLLGEGDARSAANRRENSMVALLLRGELRIYGHRVEVRFIDPLPDGVTPETLAASLDPR
jgi:hypothetical protein